jgi:hypothetical protein
MAQLHPSDGEIRYNGPPENRKAGFWDAFMFVVSSRHRTINCAILMCLMLLAIGLVVGIVEPSQFPRSLTSIRSEITFTGNDKETGIPFGAIFWSGTGVGSAVLTIATNRLYRRIRGKRARRSSGKHDATGEPQP